MVTTYSNISCVSYTTATQCEKHLCSDELYLCFIACYEKAGNDSIGDAQLCDIETKLVLCLHGELFILLPCDKAAL